MKKEGGSDMDAFTEQKVGLVTLSCITVLMPSLNRRPVGLATLPLLYGGVGHFTT